jgi:hypothetical protein
VSTTKVGAVVVAGLVVLALGMQVRDALFWRHLASITDLHVSDGLYVRDGIWGVIILLLGIFAVRGSRLSVGLLALLMAWYSRGSFATAGRLNLGAPGERVIALWAQRSAFLYLLLAAAFATYLLLALLKRRRDQANATSPSVEVL